MTVTLRRAGALDVVERRLRPVAGGDFTVTRAPDAAPVFAGHAAVYNMRTAIGNPLTWGWKEEVAPGTFDKSLAEFDQRFLVDHDTSMIVARKSAGDLRLSSDVTGVAVDADLDVLVSYIADFARNVEMRRITGMSIGFQVVRDEWTCETVETTDGDSAEIDVRRIVEAKLFEVSGVTFPAYEETDAGLRSASVQVRELRGLPMTRGASDAADPAPPVEGTRGDTGAPPVEGTRRIATQLGMRADALAARYRLNR